VLAQEKYSEERSEEEVFLVDPQEDEGEKST
jgi:hypothetical protein